MSASDIKQFEKWFYKDTGEPIANTYELCLAAWKARAALDTSLKDQNSSQDSLIKFVRANVDNDGLSDAEFRQVIWNTFKDI